MANTTVKHKEHTLWSNCPSDLNFDDWKDDLKASYPELDESELEEKMYEDNNSYLDDKCVYLKNIVFDLPIIIIGEIGRWNGTVTGYKTIESGKVVDCLYTDCDYAKWYIDENNDLRCDCSHHDGSNHYLYRTFKTSLNEDEIEEFEDKILDNTFTQEDIDKYTDSVGVAIREVYGWED